MIFPNSSISADKMSTLQKIFRSNNFTWISNFAWRPSKLFEGADMLLAIVLSTPARDVEKTYATRYYKWYNEYRDYLFHNLSFTEVTTLAKDGSIPKIPNSIYISILNRLTQAAPSRYLSHHFLSSSSSQVIFYFRAVQYWIKVLDRTPIFEEDGKKVTTGEMKPIFTATVEERYVLASVLSSCLFFTHYITWSSCQVINARDFEFPFDLSRLTPEINGKLVKLGRELQRDYQKNSDTKVRHYSKRGRKFVMRKQHFYIKESKPIINEIDCVLAQHYGFTDEELDFIINYDIKYRMGRDAGLTDDEAAKGEE
jgi:hypothetical protein